MTSGEVNKVGCQVAKAKYDSTNNNDTSTALSTTATTTTTTTATTVHVATAAVSDPLGLSNAFPFLIQSH